MCQGCVNAGDMTATELARRQAAGDPSVVPFTELEPAEFIRQVTLATVSAMATGIDPEEAVDMALRVAASYIRTRDLTEEAMEPLLKALSEI